MVFRRLIGVFARAAHPLVLFLDDLQWLDAATLALLADLATHPDVHHLLLVGAYRDNEVDRNHPLMRSAGGDPPGGRHGAGDRPDPLAREDVERLVADALHGPPRAGPAALATGAREDRRQSVLHHPVPDRPSPRRSCLRFDPGMPGPGAGTSPRIHAEGYTDNVVDLMVGKLGLPAGGHAGGPETARLSGKHRGIPGTLGLVLERPAEAIHAAFWAAVRAGLVFRQDEGYIFLHDRVQEAAYSLIPEDRAPGPTCASAESCSRLTPDEIAEQIFDVVNQLNRGARPGRVARGAGADRRAQSDGRQARQEGDGLCVGLTYLPPARRCSPRTAGSACTDSPFALELHRAECEFLTGALEAAEQRLAMLWGRAESVVDQAAVTCLRLDVT